MKVAFSLHSDWFVIVLEGFFFFGHLQEMQGGGV
jgi:hypothetical protein